MKTILLMLFIAVSVQPILSQGTSKLNISNDSTFTNQKDSTYNVFEKNKIMESLRKKYNNSKDTVFKQNTRETDDNLYVEKEKSRWRLGDMGIEASCGIGGSLLGALIGGMVGSWFHTVGDTSKSGSDITYTAVMIGLGIGHTIGNGFGVIAGGEWRDVRGSALLALVGGVAVEIPALIMYKNKRTVFTALFLAIVPSIVSTIGYNLMDKY
jgi:uncharacterized membrane protein YraQ (UPF0718 family)